MLYDHLNNQYQTPKWQARVLAPEHHFKWGNNQSVSNLWELKQALKSVEEDVFRGFVTDQNHIARWVDAVVNYRELAHAIESQKTRWGMIVTLERQMMRTMELPHFVAVRWLGRSINPFVLRDGRQIWSVYELRDALNTTSEGVLEEHLEKVPNDFSLWVRESLGNFVLADILNEAKSVVEGRMVLSDHIGLLEEAAQIS